MFQFFRFLTRFARRNNENTKTLFYIASLKHVESLVAEDQPPFILHRSHLQKFGGGVTGKKSTIPAPRLITSSELDGELDNSVSSINDSAVERSIIGFEDLMDPVMVNVNPDVFFTEEPFSYGIQHDDILHLLTNEWLDCGIITFFAMCLHNQLMTRQKSQGRPNQCFFLNPYMIQDQALTSDRENVFKYLCRAVNPFISNKQSYLILPFFQQSHWSLMILAPGKGLAFILDSLNKDKNKTHLSYNLTNIIIGCLGNRFNWTVVDDCNQQVDFWECGFYVMRWMYEFVISQPHDLSTKPPWTSRRPYTQTDIGEIVDQWMDHFADMYVYLLQGGGVTGKKYTIPAPRLITSSELEAYRPLVRERRDRDTGELYEVFDGMCLKDGYLFKKVPLDSLSFWDVRPTEAELIKFSPANKEESNDVEWLTGLFGERKKKKPSISSNKDVIAWLVMIILFVLEDFENFWSECPWEDDLKYAKAVCNQINVPLEVVHLSDEYWDKVVSYIIDEYRCGRTPNPDVLCNTRIKFGAFMDAISSMNFDFVGSGHYAKVVHPVTDEANKLTYLELSKDMVKDQTYFLSYLSQAQLKRLVFPLGCIPKDEVRILARKFNLPNQERKDSQGICFLGKIKFSEFVGRHIGEKEGIILEAETGDFLGAHRGFWFYTIGQRQGLKLAGGPWYVVEKDVKNNVVFVSRNYYSVDKRRRSFHVGSFRWISGSPPRDLDHLKCKVRHGPDFYNCILHLENAENRTETIGTVQLPEDDQGLAAGQFAVFYKEQVCVGSGVILESWDDNGFPVCDKAREIAKLEDKSKLGKPVKIKTRPEDCVRKTKCEDVARLI